MRTYYIIHILLSLSKGCLIGTNGSIFKRLESETGCRIDVNKQEGAYSCGVWSNSQSGAENGARFLIDHIIRELHLDNDYASVQGFHYKLIERNAFVFRIYLPLQKEVFFGKR